MEIIIIRHTAVEAAGICYGHYDVPLAGTFRQETEAYHLRLNHQHFDAVYTSPSLRTRQLATALGYPDALPDDRIRELHFGHWEGKRWDELQGPEMDAWMQDWTRLAPPGGESLEALFGRVQSFLSELKTRHAASHDRVLLITHSGVIRCLRAGAGKRPLSEIFEWKLGFGAIHRLLLKKQKWYFEEAAML